MNGNSLICWTPALSRYTTAQLMRWHVIYRADKHLAGTSAVQMFIYEFLRFFYEWNVVPLNI